MSLKQSLETYDNQPDHMLNATLGISFAFLAMLGFGIGNAMSQVPVRQLGAVRTIVIRNIFRLCVLSLSIKKNYH